MPSRIKSLLKPLVQSGLPPGLYRQLNAARKDVAQLPARAAFELARVGATHLDPAELPRLHRRYEKPPRVDYGAQKRTEVGRSRAARIAELVSTGTAAASGRVLELGCGDGRVCGALCSAGFEAVGIDHVSTLFDPLAQEAGAELIVMDARTLEFEDASFDLVFSHGSFEHFAEPDRVFREALRVLAPGGRLYLSFGPLYLSPLGLHAYQKISVPYCHVLFERPVLDDFVAGLGLAPIAWDGVNGWSISDFRRLFAAHREALETETYEERRDVSRCELIRRYPRCFRSKSAHFDDFVVASIVARFRKR